MIPFDLDRLLEMAGNAGLFAVISFRTGPGRSDFSVCCLGEDWFDPDIYQDDTVWTTAAAQTAWVEMWRYTAARYAANPVVAAYDLMVEPNSNDVFFDEWDPATGTFGQYIPAIPIEDTASAIQSIELIQLRGKIGATGFRTNIGLINTTDLSEEILIELYSSSSVSLGQIRLTLMPGEYRQLNRIITGLINGEVSDAWARIRTTTEGGGFFAYASLVDNASGDSIFIPGFIVDAEER